MNTQARRKRIEELLHAEGFCSVSSLAKQLDVSEVTIRNDLSSLEDEGKVTRIHGGAMLAMDRARGESFEERSTINQDKKLWIARQAATLVDNYDSLILDASTTAFYMADYLKKYRGLTVFTNGIEVAFRLAENRSNKVVLTGGLLRPETASLTGQFGNGVLGGVHINKAFLSCTGWSPTLDLMDDDLFEVQLKKEMVEVSESVILLVDSSKFEKQGVAAFAPMNRISMVITDDQVSPVHLTQLRQAGVQVNICSDHSTRVLEGGNGEKKIRIGFANQDDSASFQALVRQGLVQAATAANIELLLADNREDGPTALANADNFITQQVDGVIEFQTDAKFGNVIMDKFRAHNIPVIAIDIPMPGATFFGADNYHAGFIGGQGLGQWIQKNWNGQVDALISLELPQSGDIPAARMQGQWDGLESVVGKIPESKVKHLDSKNTLEEARRLVADVLTTLPNAHHIAVVNINDDTALGAIAAAQAAGRINDIAVVAQNATENARIEIRKPGSRFIGSTAYFPEKYGFKIIPAMLKLLQHQSVPPAIYVDHVFITKDNVDQYYPQG